MYEALNEKVFERMLEHYKENRNLSFDEFIEIIKEENRRILIEDQKCIYGELEIDAVDIFPAT